MFRALAFDLVKTLELFFLLPQLPNHAFHRGRHEGGRIFRSGRGRRDAFLLRSLRAQKESSKQEKKNSHDCQDPRGHANGDLPKVWGGFGLECYESHRLSWPRMGETLSATPAQD